jgi:transmembrane sensor
LEEGEAFFSVAKNLSRPFFVETSAGTIRVTGTRFNVRNEAGKVDVTVLEGSVAVRPQTGEPQSLSPQDQLSLEGGKVSIRKLSAGAAQDVIAWREGRIVFESEPLAQAAARFAHYHGKEITVASGVAALELGGVFRLDDLDQFLTDVAVSLPVQVLRSPNGPVRIVAR